MQKILYFVGGVFLFLGNGLLASDEPPETMVNLCFSTSIRPITATFATYRDSQKLELVTSPLSPAALVFIEEGHYFV